MGTSPRSVREDPGIRSTTVLLAVRATSCELSGGQLIPHEPAAFAELCFRLAGWPMSFFLPIRMEVVCRLVKLLLWSVGACVSLGHLTAAKDGTGIPEQKQVAPSSAGFGNETLCYGFTGLGSGDCTGPDSNKVTTPMPKVCLALKTWHFPGAPLAFRACSFTSLALYSLLSFFSITFTFHTPSLPIQYALFCQRFHLDRLAASYHCGFSHSCVSSRSSYKLPVCCCRLCLRRRLRPR